MVEQLFRMREALNQNGCVDGLLSLQEVGTQLVWIVECLYHSVPLSVSHTCNVFHAVPCFHMDLSGTEKESPATYCGKYDCSSLFRWTVVSEH